MSNNKQNIHEVEQPQSQGEKNFKALHNPIKHTSLVPGVTDQEHVFKGAMKPYDNKFPNSNKPGQDRAAYDKTLKMNDAETDNGYEDQEHAYQMEEDFEQVDEVKLVSTSLNKQRASHIPGTEKKISKLINTEPMDKRYPSGSVAARQYKIRGVHTGIPHHSEEVEMDEAAYSAKAARHGKDIGKPGKNFAKIEKSAAERYGSEEAGKKVAGAVLAKIRAKHMKEDTDGEGNNPPVVGQALKQKNPNDMSSYWLKNQKDTDQATEKLRQMIAMTYGGGNKSSAEIIDSGVRKEEVESVDEVLSKKAPASQWIRDFIDSKNPKFTGKSKEERRKMALGAYYAKQNEEYVSEDSDYASSMLKTELNAISHKAGKLVDYMIDGMEVEPWVQAKVARAKEEIDNVFDYLMFSDDGINPRYNEEPAPEPESPYWVPTSMSYPMMNREEKELSPKQKAIAKLRPPRDKIDAGDLAALRHGEKPIKEASRLCKDCKEGHYVETKGGWKCDECGGTPHSMSEAKDDFDWKNTSHFEHGVHAAKEELKTGKKAKSWHKPGTPEYKEFMRGYDSVMKKHMKEDNVGTYGSSTVTTSMKPDLASMKKKPADKQRDDEIAKNDKKLKEETDSLNLVKQSALNGMKLRMKGLHKNYGKVQGQKSPFQNNLMKSPEDVKEQVLSSSEQTLIEEILKASE